VVGRLLSRLEICRASIMSASTRYIGFDTNNRLDPLLLHLVIERESAIEIAMVGDRNGRHIQLGCAFRKRSNLDCTIQQAIIRVQVKMYKLFIRHSLTKNQPG